jgi:hypothetical protein
MEHLRLDNQRSPAVSLDPETQHIFHYVYIRGRCSLVELFPIFARREGFLQKLESLLAQGHLFTDLKSIWAREKQIIFTETPLSTPEESASPILSRLNNQVHRVAAHFDYQHAVYINRDFQLQWHKIPLQPGDQFYLGHFEDFRGRIYCKGHILTYQGTDFQKSLIRCEPYYVDQASLEILHMDVARSYGLDKATWAERLQWSLAHPEFQEGAKEPFLYKSAWEALRGAQEGCAVDHLVSLDATASGIQCLALMAQDSASAEAVNLGTTTVNNPYRRVKEHMGNYDYERVKRALMTSFYESVATPLELFGSDYDKFVQAAQTMLPGPWAMKEAISSCMTYKDQYSWTMMDGYEVVMDVTTPIECSMDIGQGHMISWMEHRKAPVGTKGLTANITHSLDALVLREVLRRTNCPLQWYPVETPFEELREKDILLLQSIVRYNRTQFLTYELLDHVDQYNQHLVPQGLRDEINSRTHCDEMYIQPIHDCYRVRATDVSTLFEVVKEVMADLAYARTADWLLPQIGYTGKINDSESRRSSLKDQVLDSSYLIC